MALVDRIALLQYDVPGRIINHERHILQHATGDDYAVLTPDGDVYIETMSVSNPDLRAFRLRPAAGVLPPGVTPNSVYALPVFTPAQMTAFRAEAQREVAAALAVGGGGLGGAAVVAAPAAIPGAPPAVPAGAVAVSRVAGQLQWLAAENRGGYPCAPPAVPAGAVAVSRVAGQLQWLAAENRGGYRFGDVVSGIVSVPVEHGRLVHVLPDGQSIFVQCVDGGKVDDFLGVPALSDHRILPVKYNAMGVPERSLAEVAATCREEPVKWTLPGPRTAKWCVTYLSVEAIGFEAHHERLRSLCKLEPNSWGVQEHFQLSMTLRHALQIDQVDGFNLVFVEVMFRRLQTIEYAHSERAREAESKSVGGRLSIEEQQTFGGLAPFLGHGASLAQAQALEFVKQSVHAMGTPPEDLSRQGAHDMLRATGVYGGDQAPSALGSYNPALLSLPNEGNVPVPLEDLWGEGGHEFVGTFIRNVILPESVAKSKIQASGLRHCYSDPLLRHPRTFSQLVKRLHDCGLVTYSLEPSKSYVELFFVKKKNGMLRMVVDCRHSNEWFAAPIGVALSTGDALSRIELEPNQKLYFASADLKDAFYHLELPHGIRHLFGLRGVRAGDIGLESVNGVPVPWHQTIYPQLSAVPMGWTWALYLCQTLHERIVGQVGADDTSRLSDKKPAPDSTVLHTEYVDNFHVIGTDEEAVTQLSQSGIRALRGTGLVVHEEEQSSGSAQILGWEFSSDGTLRPTSRRLWKVRLAILHLLTCGRVSGQQLERVIGHMSFISMVRREGLSILGDCYTFIQRHYHVPSKLWKSVRRELSIWYGIAPLLWKDLSAEWSTTIYATDASDWGSGVTTSTMDSLSIRELGRYAERWRFKDDRWRYPRRSSPSLFSADEADDVVAHGWDQHNDTTQSSLPDTSGVQFVPLPFSAVDRPWKVVGRWKWKRQESMPILEARATLFAVKHMVRSTSNYGKRILVFSDSMTAVASISRGRAHSRGLRRVVQQIAALCLCSSVCIHTRWCPSEWNPADSPSRVGQSQSSNHRTSRRSRARTRQAAVTMPARQLAQQTVLQWSSVTAATRSTYLRHWAQFSSWATQNRLALHSSEEVDRALTLYLEELYLDGSDLSMGRYVVASVTFVRPDLRSPAMQRLPGTKQSLQGWRNLCPPQSRLPVPWEVACLVSAWAFKRMMLQMGVGLLMMFTLYLRPSEMCRLKVRDVVFPNRRLRRNHQKTVVTLHKAQRPSCNTEKRKMAGDGFSPKIREGRQTSSTPQQTSRCNTGTGKLGKRKRRAGLLQPAPAQSHSLTTPCFLEIFSGSGHLAKAIHQVTSWDCITWDILHGSEYDLRSLTKRNRILGWIKSGMIRGVHLGTPCASFSRARDRRPGPPPLRSDTQPLGFSDLGYADLVKVREGNLWMRFSSQVFNLCMKLHIPVTMENPFRSRIWLCPPIKYLLRRKQCYNVDVDYCTFGTRWRKRTKFLYYGVDLQRLGIHRCCNSKRGICAFSGKPHLQLMGVTTSGVFMTKLAEPYPVQLCVNIAHAFLDWHTGIIADNFWKRLWPDSKATMGG
eukprot:Skav200217  [mRNA]  locus=scaffold3745:15519:20956:- [translate_table: standard]